MKHIKKITIFVLCSCLIFTLNGCSASKYRTINIEDVNNLEGLTIGVPLSWESDYLLTGRSDLTLKRYNTISDVIVALECNRIEAAAFEYAIANTICSSIPALSMDERSLSPAEQIILFSKENKECCNEFNQFIKEFKKTDRYKTLIVESKKPDYKPKYIKLKGGSKKLTVVSEEYQPYAYTDFDKRRMVGVDVEILSEFANAYGYDLDLTSTSYFSAIMSIKYKTADIMIGGISKTYADDIEKQDIAIGSDIYATSKIVLVTVGDASKLSEVPDDILDY